MMSEVTEFWDASSITRATVTAIDDGKRGQQITLKGFRSETFTDVLRAQPHGFSSHPPIGAIGHFLRLGSSDRLVALGFETDKRPLSSPPGTSVLYDDKGNVIFAKGSAGVSIKAVEGGIMVEAMTGTITTKRGGMTVTLSDSRVDLGGLGGPAVLTTGGPSSKVFAII